MKLKVFALSFVFLLFYFCLFTLSSAQTSPPNPASNASNSAIATNSTSLTPTLPSPKTGADFTVSPSVLYLEVLPASSSSQVLKIRNNNNTPESITLSVAKVTSSAQGNPIITDFPANDPLPTWISFSETSFIVNPDNWYSLTMTFSPPANAALGYYFAVVFNRSQNLAPQSGQAAVQAAPAIITLADVTSDTAAPGMTMVSFTTTKKWYDFLPVEFMVTLQNTGNIHLKAVGNIFIDQGNTKDVAILSLNDTEGYILPHASRTFTVSWADGFPIYTPTTNDQGEVSKKLTWDWGKMSQFRLGKFIATALAIYDDGTRDVPMESSLTFWIIPWQILTIAAIVTLVLIIGIFAIFKLLISPFRSRK